jgi:hypothetical protein
MSLAMNQSRFLSHGRPISPRIPDWMSELLLVAARLLLLFRTYAY